MEERQIGNGCTFKYVLFKFLLAMLTDFSNLNISEDLKQTYCCYTVVPL